MRSGAGAVTEPPDTPPSEPLELLHASVFEPVVGETFHVDATADSGGGTTVSLALVLEEVVEASATGPGSPLRTPFTLTFTGPPDAHLLQGLYELRHPALGITAIFLVPIGPRPDGRPRYEAIFN